MLIVRSIYIYIYISRSRSVYVYFYERIYILYERIFIIFVMYSVPEAVPYMYKCCSFFILRNIQEYTSCVYINRVVMFFFFFFNAFDSSTRAHTRGRERFDFRLRISLAPRCRSRRTRREDEYQLRPTE